MVVDLSLLRSVLGRKPTNEGFTLFRQIFSFYSTEQPKNEIAEIENIELNE